MSFVITKSRLWSIHFVPLSFLLLLVLIVHRHFLFSPSTSYGMANTDNEGTLWWIWSKCVETDTSRIFSHIGAPFGFDHSRMASYNLVDQLRIEIARVGNCSPDTVVATFSLFPIFAMIFNIYAGYALGWIVFRSRWAGISAALFGVMSSQVLLSTRTSLANILIAPGIIALAFFLRSRYNSSKWNIFLVAFFLCIQMLTNAYNGFIFMYLVLGYLVIFSIIQRSEVQRTMVYSGLAGLVGAVIGSIPILTNQIFLVTDAELRQQFRPVNISDEAVNPRVLISRPYRWFEEIVPDVFTQVEAGWISLPLLIGLLIALPVLFRSRNTVTDLKLVQATFLLLTTVLLLIFAFPGTGFIRDIYAVGVFPLRGISNYAKVIPLLSGMIMVAMIHVYLEKTKRPSYTTFRTLMIGLSLLLSVHIVDNVPTTSTFRERNSLKTVEDFYNQFPKPDYPVVAAHYPDWTYAAEWGFPSRFIQIAQIYTQTRIANGRDGVSDHGRCSTLPTPVDTDTLKVLQDRGVNRVVLHTKLMDSISFNKAMDYLLSTGLTPVQISSPHLNVDSQVNSSLEVVIFELSSHSDASPCLQTKN